MAIFLGHRSDRYRCFLVNRAPVRQKPARKRPFFWGLTATGGLLPQIDIASAQIGIRFSETYYFPGVAIFLGYGYIR